MLYYFSDPDVRAASDAHRAEIKAAFESLKQATVYDRPHLKRSAWVGTEALPKIFHENLKAFSQRDLPTFKTREEALEWLVAEEKMASGQ